jgi:hypothetical protein
MMPAKGRPKESFLHFSLVLVIILVFVILAINSFDVPVVGARPEEQQTSTTKTTGTKHDITSTRTEEQEAIVKATPAACISEQATVRAIVLAPGISDHPKLVWVVLQDAAARDFST